MTGGTGSPFLYSDEVRQPQQPASPDSGSRDPPRGLYDLRCPISPELRIEGRADARRRSLWGSYLWPVSGRSRWVEAAAWFVVWWGLATVGFRLVGLLINDLKSWPMCAGMAVASIATGELSERWRRRRRKRKSGRLLTPCLRQAAPQAHQIERGNSGESR
jgi:hypothetical protein